MTTSGSSSTTTEPTDEELCAAAAKNPNAAVILDMIGSCSAASTVWSYALSLLQNSVDTMCGINNPKIGFITNSMSEETETGVILAQSLRVGPWNGAEGLIQGEFKNIDLSNAKNPCFVTRLAYGTGAPPEQELLAQVLVRASGVPDLELFPTMPMTTIPHNSEISLTLPIPQDFVGKMIDIVVLTIKQNAAPDVQHTLLWEHPRIIDAG